MNQRYTVTLDVEFTETEPDSDGTAEWLIGMLQLAREGSPISGERFTVHGLAVQRYEGA